MFDDGRNGAANEIERRDAQGGVVRSGAQGYMLFREGVRPETNFERDGERVNKNGYRTEVSCSPSDFQNFQDAWETCVLAVIGEVVDPAEYINGAYLTDKQGSGKRTAALRLEVWFNERSDDVCENICAELVKVLKQTNKSGVTSGVAELPFRFSKVGPRRADASRAPLAHPGRAHFSTLARRCPTSSRSTAASTTLLET